VERRAWNTPCLAVLLVAVPAGLHPARAEDKPNLGWSDTAELSYVVTAGNAETSTFGFKDFLKRTWEKAAFELKVGGVRAESTKTTRVVTAAGPPPVVDESSATDLTAENYYLNARHNRNFSARSFWFGGAGWDRNRLAGVDNRYVATAGFGTQWVDKERVQFRTDYSATVTRQEDVVDDPDTKDTFPGARFTWAYLHLLGANTTYGNDLIVDENLDETSDFRADMINSVAVNMSDHLALKVSLQWLYDHEPSFATADDPLALLPPGQVALVQLDTLDTIFTTSLVVKF